MKAPALKRKQYEDESLWRFCQQVCNNLLVALLEAAATASCLRSMSLQHFLHSTESSQETTYRISSSTPHTSRNTASW